MGDDSDQFTSYLDTTNKASKRKKQSPYVINEFASMLKDSISPDSTFITINNKTPETVNKIPPVSVNYNMKNESNLGVDEAHQLGINEAHQLGINGIKVIEVECDNLEDLGETFDAGNYKNLDKTNEELIKDNITCPASIKENLQQSANEQPLSHTTLLQHEHSVKINNQEGINHLQQKTQIHKAIEKENQNIPTEPKLTEEINDEEITSHLKTIDFLIKKNSDQKTIKILELQLTEQKEKEKNYNKQKETLNKQIKHLTAENNELKRENEILKILSKEIHKKSDKNSKNLKENYEIMEALEMGREKLEFLKKSYEIEKKNFQLDISDLKREVIRVNRDNVFLKTIVKELSIKLDQSGNIEENE